MLVMCPMVWFTSLVALDCSVEAVAIWRDHVAHLLRGTNDLRQS